MPFWKSDTRAKTCMWISKYRVIKLITNNNYNNNKSQVIILCNEKSFYIMIIFTYTCESWFVLLYYTCDCGSNEIFRVVNDDSSLVSTIWNVSKQLFNRQRYRYTGRCAHNNSAPYHATAYNVVPVCLSTRMTAVNLTSSATCPGGTVVFTCITDTGRLVWCVNNNNELYYLPRQVSEIGRTRDIFTLRLISVTGSVFVSTATAHNVSYGSNGINITCIDSDIISAATNTRIGTIKISIKLTIS